MKKWILLLAGVIAGICVWKFMPQDIATVQTVEVSKQRVAKTVTNTRSGSVQACRRAKLSVPLGGQIASIPVSEGDKVQKDAVLLSLFNDDIQAQLRQARYQLDAARLNQQRACVIAQADQREANRHQSLFTKKLISDEQLDVSVSRARASALACDVSQADSNQVKSQIEWYQAQLSKTQILAPFTGTIAEINGEVGEFATPSPPGIPTLPMIDLIDDSCFYVSAPIDEVDAGALALGQPVAITLDAYRGQTFAGRVQRIAPYVFAREKQARTVEIEVEIIDNFATLLVGYSADVSIEIEATENVLSVPTQAIVNNNQVWVVKDGQVALRTVSVGLENWQVTEITEGLALGEHVVLSSNGVVLEPGMQVNTATDAL
ncbi:efflux RND transporter periplasmic adaptor subunit [Alteromonas antoniana]|uniref:efflux RND transporter periplasmic adaptor subunit n=1 Tax=Alteromonas antoniana TaxID=2803813 RepID=UPI001C44E43B|nr:efflux RND transporter periplasmic adaptor subunit [Alteromonas antoniana]